MPFLDELESGIAPLSSNEVGAAFALAPGTAAGLALLAMQVLAVVAEPPLLLAADRRGQRDLFIRGGLLTLALSCFAVAAAPSWWVFVVALMLFGPASGVVCGLSQATLVDLNPEQPERVLARWTLMGSVGDLATPALLALLTMLGLGWRSAFAFSAALSLGAAWLWRPAPTPRPVETDDAPAVVPTSVWAALKRPRLVAWLFGVSLCTLLDEPLVAFGALHLQQRFGLVSPGRELALSAWMLGSVAGSTALDRLLSRFTPAGLLRVFAAMATWSVLGFAFAPGAASATGALLALGFFGTALHPLASAQAYRALPGESGLVAAVGAALVPFEMALPLGLGLVLDHAGSTAAIVLLAVQPVYLALIAPKR